MKKKIVKTVLVIALLLLFILPVRIAFYKDGGSSSYSPIVPWYVIWNLNRIHPSEPLSSHDDPDCHPIQSYYEKGTEIEIFGKFIYQNTYEVPSNT